MNEKKIYTGNTAAGYTTTNNGISEKVYTEQVARRDGVIYGAIPTWAKCCGWNNK